MNATLTFNERGGLVESVGLVQGPANLTLARVHRGAPPRHRAAGRRSPRHAAAGGVGRAPDRSAQLAVVPRRRRRAATATASARSPSGTWPPARTSSGRRRFPASPPRARSSGAIASSSTTAISKAGDNTLQDRPLRRREAGGRPVRRTSGRSTASTRRPEKSCGSARPSPARRRPSGTRRAARPAPRRRPTASAWWRCSDRRAC